MKTQVSRIKRIVAVGCVGLGLSFSLATGWSRAGLVYDPSGTLLAKSNAANGHATRTERNERTGTAAGSITGTDPLTICAMALSALPLLRRRQARN